MIRIKKLFTSLVVFDKAEGLYKVKKIALTLKSYSPIVLQMYLYLTITYSYNLNNRSDEITLEYLYQ